MLCKLQVARRIPEYLLKILVENLELDGNDVYPIDGPLDLSRLRQLGSIDRPDLKDAPFTAYTPPELRPKAKDDIFTTIARGDIVLHHPYESFQPVIEFVGQGGGRSGCSGDEDDAVSCKGLARRSSRVCCTRSRTASRWPC